MIEIKPSHKLKNQKLDQRSRSFMRESLEYIKNVSKLFADVYCNDNA